MLLFHPEALVFADTYTAFRLFVLSGRFEVNDSKGKYAI
jgi:hypothetical protein